MRKNRKVEGVATHIRFLTGGERWWIIFPVMKVARQCSLVLLVKVEE
jgi:hypothetical protein